MSNQVEEIIDKSYGRPICMVGTVIFKDPSTSVGDVVAYTDDSLWIVASACGVKDQKRVKMYLWENGQIYFSRVKYPSLSKLEPVLSASNVPPDAQWTIKSHEFTRFLSEKFEDPPSTPLCQPEISLPAQSNSYLLNLKEQLISEADRLNFSEVPFLTVSEQIRYLDRISPESRYSSFDFSCNDLRPCDLPQIIQLVQKYKTDSLESVDLSWNGLDSLESIPLIDKLVLELQPRFLVLFGNKIAVPPLLSDLLAGNPEKMSTIIWIQFLENDSWRSISPCKENENLIEATHANFYSDKFLR